jgi:hypothetical protein
MRTGGAVPTRSKKRCVLVVHLSRFVEPNRDERKANRRNKTIDVENKSNKYVHNGRTTIFTSWLVDTSLRNNLRIGRVHLLSLTRDTRRDSEDKIEEQDNGASRAHQDALYTHTHTCKRRYNVANALAGMSE